MENGSVASVAVYFGHPKYHKRRKKNKKKREVDLCNRNSCAMCDTPHELQPISSHPTKNPLQTLKNTLKKEKEKPQLKWYFKRLEKPLNPLLQKNE